jgi:hypothetical protein
MSVSYPLSLNTQMMRYIFLYKKSYKTINYEISDVIEDKIDYSLLILVLKCLDKLKAPPDKDIATILEKLG